MIKMTEVQDVVRMREASINTREYTRHENTLAYTLSHDTWEIARLKRCTSISKLTAA